MQSTSAQYTNLTYSSTGQNPFETWKRVFISVVAGIILFAFLSIPLVFSLILLFLIAFSVGTLMTTLKVSDIQRLNQDINFKDNKQNETIRNLKSIETWWNYDLSESTSVLSMGTPGETRGHSNKMNIYAKFISDDHEIVIFEQILISDKFPHNHEYKHDVTIDEIPTFKVWDVDKCLNKLKLSSFVIPKRAA